jgi:hypothetical protein
MGKDLIEETLANDRWLTNRDGYERWDAIYDRGR